MLKNLSQVSLKLLSFLIFFTVGINFCLPSFAQTNRDLGENLPSDWSFTPPRGIGHPGGTEAGGTRGNSSCIAENESLILLVPPTNITYTTNGYPSFAWYVPPNSAAKVKFTLYDQNYQEIYTVESNLAPTSNRQGQIMSISLPDSIALEPLSLDQVYPWEVSLICNPIYRFNDIKTESLIQRVSLNSSLENQLETASLEEQVILYANANPYPLWTDTLNSLMLLRRAQPNNQEVEQAWLKLLKSAQLEEVLP